MERGRSTGWRQDSSAVQRAGSAGWFNGAAVSGGSDVTPPTLTGSLTISAKDHDSYTVSWPAGSDNVAVTTYRISLNGGANWTDLGLVLTTGVLGRAPGSTDNVEVQAGDAAGNWSASLSAAVTLLSLKVAPIILDPQNSTPRASQTGIGILVLGEKPGSTANPTVLASSATETTDGSGVLDILLNSSGKAPGDIVWLVMVKSDGVPANAGYGVAWPLAVVAA